MKWTIVAVLLISFVAPPAQAQTQYKSYFRSSIEGWTEREKAMLIPFLDECRIAADEVVADLAKRDINAIYDKAAIQLRRRESRDELESELAALENMAGRLVSANYVHQSLVLAPGDDIAAPRRPESQIHYSIVATKSQDSSLRLAISLTKSEGKCRAYAIQYVRYFDMPPWLRGAQ